MVNAKMPGTLQGVSFGAIVEKFNSQILTLQFLNWTSQRWTAQSADSVERAVFEHICKILYDKNFRQQSPRSKMRRQ